MTTADMQDSNHFCSKALLPLISSQYFDASAQDSAGANDLPLNYDPNRRSSLGAESLLEHDISEESSNLDDCCDSLLAEAQLGVEYADDVFLLNRYKEHLHHPKRYIEEQPQVTEHMRCTLINWLVKVNRELHFGPETIFIAVSLTDRFLASTPIAQDCLQLLAVCALFVAAKLEESVVPGISALVSLCGSTYRHYHFRRMEALLLSTLRFQLHTPTSWFFVTYIALRSSRLVPLERKTLNLARYVIETCLASYRISQFYPSEQAASALAYSCYALYSPSSGFSSDQESRMESTESGCGTASNCFSILSGLNAPASNLNWTFHTIFSTKELEKINVCFCEMESYMKPFINSPGISVPSFYSQNTDDSSRDVAFVERKDDIPNCKDTDSSKERDSDTYVPHTYSYYNEDKEIFERVTIKHRSSEVNAYERVFPGASNTQDKIYSLKRENSMPSMPSIRGKKQASFVQTYNDDPMDNESSDMLDYKWANSDCSLRNSDWNVT